MKTSETDRGQGRLHLYPGADGRLLPWPPQSGDAVLDDAGSDSVWLIVPADQVAISFIPLPDELTDAQAAAAARLRLAADTAEPMDALHLAVGPGRDGVRPVAHLRPELLEAWLDVARGQGIEPAAIVPAPMLLSPPETGFRRNRDDYRSQDSAFTMEADLAALITGDAPIESVDETRMAADAAGLDHPPLDLRQGRFALHRPGALSSRRLARIAALVFLLAGLTLGLQVATLLRYTFAADRLEAEANRLAAAPDTAPPFSASAAALFAAIRATPNIEVGGLRYGPDGRLSAALLFDSPATLDLLRRRLEASLFRVQAGAIRTDGSRSTALLVMTLS